jgi:multiple sugar transport system permease protein
VTLAEQSTRPARATGDAEPERIGWAGRNRETVEAWLFLLPFLLVYTVLQIYPVFQAALMSLFRWDLLDPSRREFVGGDNYVDMLGATGLTWDATNLLGWRIVGLVLLVGLAVAVAKRRLDVRRAVGFGAVVILIFGVLLGLHPGPDDAWYDALFWQSFGNTILFVVLSTPVIVGIALLLALALNGRGRYVGLLRAAFFAPYVLSVAVLTLIWGFLLNPDLGLVASALSAIGLEPVSWLTDPSLALPTIVVVTLWWTMGFNLVLFIAGLQDIEPSLYEAATLDGAGPWGRFRNVTVPGLRRTLVLVSVLQVIASFQIFGQVYILTRGGPANSTRVLIQNIYESGFREFRLGYAAAQSVFLFLVMLIVSIVQLKIMREEDEA